MRSRRACASAARRARMLPHATISRVGHPPRSKHHPHPGMTDAPRKASLAVIFLTVFIDLLGFGMVLPLLPIYAKDFAAQLGLEEGHTKVGVLIGLLMSSFSVM